jgi:hypothetical protein
MNFILKLGDWSKSDPFTILGEIPMNRGEQRLYTGMDIKNRGNIPNSYTAVSTFDNISEIDLG